MYVCIYSMDAMMFLVLMKDNMSGEEQKTGIYSRRPGNLSYDFRDQFC